jgi:hypothetical protein
MKLPLIFASSLLLSACQKSRNNPDEWEVEEVPLGYRGQARINPYLAAERFLSANGYNAKSSLVWSESEENMDIIMIPASFLSTKGMGMRALDWVEGGGMLVITVEGGEGEINDHQNTMRYFWSEEPDLLGFDYLIDKTGIEIEQNGWEVVEGTEANGHLVSSWHTADFELMQNGETKNYQVEFQGNVALSAKLGERWESADENIGRMVTTEFGYGYIMVLAHARAFRNAYIDRADHAQFVMQVANWRGAKSIVFLYGSGTSFMGLLWQHTSQAIIAGLLLLAFWLWMRIPRFGPLKEDDHIVLSGYGDDLSASARFLWRKKQLHHYLRPLRDRIKNKNHDDSQNHYQLLAKRSGLSREEIVEAMTASEIKDPASLTRIVHRLQTILKS